MKLSSINIIIVCLSIGALKACGPAGGKRNNPSDDSNVNTQNQEVSTPLIKSQVSRDKGTDSISYLDLSIALKNETLKANIILSPTPSLDRDELSKRRATRVSKISESIEEDNCGDSIQSTSSIPDRVTECQKKISNPAANYWAAKESGTSGEGDWALVSYIYEKDDSAPKKSKVWRDLSTGLLWSDIVASGSYIEAIGFDPTSETRLQSLCDSQLNSPKPAFGNISPKQVKWRLPNRSEFLQADINGARSVLSNTKNLFWTASFEGIPEGSTDITAWAINQSTGVLEKVDVNTVIQVRCIGVSIE